MNVIQLWNTMLHTCCENIEIKTDLSILPTADRCRHVDAHHQNDVAENVAVLEHEIVDLTEAVEQLLANAGRRFGVCSGTCLIALYFTCFVCRFFFK